MKLTLVRHGEVEAGFQHCYNGHNLISLSNKGKSQAFELGKQLKGFHFDAVYCSDLPRCVQTMQQIKKERVDFEVIYTASLREKSWGRHEGLSFEQICKLDNLYYKDFLQWINALDGQKIEDYNKQIKQFFQELTVSADQHVLIVTHAGVIRTLLQLLQKITVEEAFSTVLPYGSYLELAIEKIDFTD